MTRLTPFEIDKRNKLLEKFKINNLTYDEALELKQLLEKEKQEASDAGQIVIVLGIIFLLGLLIAFLNDEKKKRR